MLKNRLEEDQRELASRIGRWLPNDGNTEIQPGVFLYRSSSTEQRVYSVAGPCLCVIAQGSKEVLLGENRFRYDPAKYLISTMELPVSGRVVEASAEVPYLSLRLVLDQAIVTSVMVEAGYSGTAADASPTGLDVSQLDQKLLDPVVRLVRLLDDPLEYQMLAAATIREIVFRWISGQQGNRLRHIARLGNQSHRMVQAVQKIRSRFDQAIRVEDLANELSMSVSSFHAHFKSATSMSPIQFQKQLRLQEARRMMVEEERDASEAALRVGYEDAAQFNREYKREFGLPPKKDADRLRSQSIV